MFLSKTMRKKYALISGQSNGSYFQELMISTSYRRVQSAIWQIFYELFIFCDVFHEPSDKWNNIPVDTGRKLNVHKTFRRRPGRPMYVQFMSCVYGDRYCLMPLSFVLGEYNAKKQFHQKFYKIIYFFAKFDIS